MPLEITDGYRGFSTSMKIISGFTTDELEMLNRMQYQDMKKAVLTMLDERNNGIGTAWMCGYGVYQMWMNGERVYVEIGNSCD